MIRKPFIFEYFDAARLGGNLRGTYLIIDAPTHVLCPCLPPVRPPGVLILARFDGAEDIHPARFVKHPIHPLPLVWQKSGVFLVGTPVSQINLPVGDIPVATDDVISPVVREFC